LTGTLGSRTLNCVKRPHQVDPLTQKERALIDQLLGEIEQQFEEGHDRYLVNISVDGRAPERVWWEVLRDTALAGWSVSFRGSVVTVTRGTLALRRDGRRPERGCRVLDIHGRRT
jgi:hypothetical protein